MIQKQPENTDADARAEKEAQRKELGDEIERTSAEGRPAHPEMGPGRIGALLALIALMILIAGVIVGLTVRPMAGVLITGLGVLVLVVNPEVWAAIFRARERGKAKRRIRDRSQRSASPEREGNKS